MGRPTRISGVEGKNKKGKTKGTTSPGYYMPTDARKGGKRDGDFVGAIGLGGRRV